MFPEGGNYGHKEAVNTIHMLKHLSNKILRKHTSILEKLKANNFESVTEIKTTLLELIKPYLFFSPIKKILPILIVF